MLPATEPSNPPTDPERDLEGSFVPLLHGKIICHRVIPDNVWMPLQQFTSSTKMAEKRQEWERPSALKGRSGTSGT